MALFAFGLGWQELLIILIILVVIFGGTKIAGLGKASGRAIREFKDELHGPDGQTPPPTAPDAGLTTTTPTANSSQATPPASDLR